MHFVSTRVKRGIKIASKIEFIIFSIFIVKKPKFWQKIIFLKKTTMLNTFNGKFGKKWCNKFLHFFSCNGQIGCKKPEYWTDDFLSKYEILGGKWKSYQTSIVVIPITSLFQTAMVTASSTEEGDVRNLAFYRKTRRGGFIKIVRELYLRADIPCGSKLCSQCSGSKILDEASPDNNGPITYFLLDTNVILQVSGWIFPCLLHWNNASSNN